MLRKINILMMSLLIGPVGSVMAAEYEYPELQVVPRASQTLHREAKAEKKNAWGQQVFMQSSAVMSILGGYLVMDDPVKDELKETQVAGDKSDTYWAGVVSIANGGLWLGITSYMASAYTPYADGWRKVSKMPKGSKRDKLARERMAEEYLRAPASLGRKLKWLSVGTNLGVAMSILSVTETKTTQAVAGLSAVMAFAPVVFDYQWRHVYKQHRRYKKRIYGPVTSMGVMRSKVTGGLVPSLNFSYRI